MADQFKRVLRIRALIEDLSQADLERHVAEAARIEKLLHDETKLQSRMRIEDFAALLKAAGAGGTTTGAEWEHFYFARTEREESLHRAESFRKLAEMEDRCVISCREDFLVKRKERRQVEMLLESQVQSRELEWERREQRDIDDWFAASKFWICRRAKRG